MLSRVGPLSREQISAYRADGYLAPIPLLDAVDAARLKRIVEDHVNGRSDPPRPAASPASGGDRLASEEHPYHFRVWGWKDQFSQACEGTVQALEAVATDSAVAGLARQLIGCRQVLLMEANPVMKTPGGLPVPWHQDYSYWPLAEPAAVTLWIALEDVIPENGSMAVVPGSHLWGERLPVSLGDAETDGFGRTGPLGQTFMKQARPDLPEIPSHPDQGELPVVAYRLRAGDCGAHHPLLWHSSTANETSGSRQVVILRYVAAGTVWLGSTRGLYRDVGCPDGQPLDGRHFPPVAAAF